MGVKNQNMPLVSVITSCYNQAPYLLETLESVKNQTYKNIQLIMWDDCSSDNSVELIEKWIADNEVDCVFLKHEKNMGICKSLNEAFSYVKGKYLQLTAMDDILLPDKIERHVEILESSSEKDALVFSNGIIIDGNSRDTGKFFLEYHGKNSEDLHSGNYYQMLLIGPFMPCMSILYRVDVIRQLNGWDENLKFEDYDMLLRIAQNFNFIFDNNSTVKYRLHETNLHKTHSSYDIDYAKIYSKHIEQDDIKNRFHDILKDLYFKNNPKLQEWRKIYFAHSLGDSFLLKCIKYNIPVKVYNILRKLKKTIC